MKSLFSALLLARYARSQQFSVVSGRDHQFADVAINMLEEIGVATSDIDNLKNHGCWGGRLMGQRQEAWLIPPNPRFDAMDGHIRDWNALRTCVKKHGGNCATGIPEENYGPINRTAGTDVCDDVEDNCLNALCVIDKMQAEKIQAEIAGTTWTPPTEATCNTTQTPKSCNYCSGSVPDLVCSTIPQPIAECTAKELDLWLNIDGSGSVKKKYFNQMRNWLIKFVEMLDIAPTKIRVGASQWAMTQRTEFGFMDDKVALLDVMGPMQYLNEGCPTCTRTGASLEYAYNEITKAGSARAGVPIVLITLTDGKAHDLTGPLADAVTPAMTKIENYGIKAFAVGIGSTKAQVTSFKTSDGDSWTLLGNDAFNQLANIIEDLAKKSCDV